MNTNIRKPIGPTLIISPLSPAFGNTKIGDAILSTRPIFLKPKIQKGDSGELVLEKQKKKNRENINLIQMQTDSQIPKPKFMTIASNLLIPDKNATIRKERTRARQIPITHSEPNKADSKENIEKNTINTNVMHLNILSAKPKRNNNKNTIALKNITLKPSKDSHFAFTPSIYKPEIVNQFKFDAVLATACGIVKRKLDLKNKELRISTDSNLTATTIVHNSNHSSLRHSIKTNIT